MNEQPSSPFSTENQMSVLPARKIPTLPAESLTPMAHMAPYASLRGPDKAWRTTISQAATSEHSSWGRTSQRQSETDWNTNLHTVIWNTNLHTVIHTISLLLVMSIYFALHVISLG